MLFYYYCSQKQEAADLYFMNHKEHNFHFCVTYPCNATLHTFQTILPNVDPPSPAAQWKNTAFLKRDSQVSTLGLTAFDS